MSTHRKRNVALDLCSEKSTGKEISEDKRNIDVLDRERNVGGEQYFDTEINLEK